ncbi:hypothetical protein ACVWYF_002208 [Hymenobacter sp. UYAg731]
MFLLSIALLTACETQSKMKEVAATGNALPHSGITVAVVKDSARQQATSAAPSQTEQAIPREASQGTVQPHPMQFRRISDEDLKQEMAIGNIMADTVLGRFLVNAEWHKPTFLYYRTSVYPGGWIEVQLEPVGEWLWNKVVTLDTVRLEPTGTPAVRVMFSSESELHHWSISNEGINIVDIAREPVLLLKAGTASHEGGFTGEDETDSTDTQREEHSFEVVQSQSIKVRNQLIVVEPAVEDGQYALHSVPPGIYRYRHGRMIQIRK